VAPVPLQVGTGARVGKVVPESSLLVRSFIEDSDELLDNLRRQSTRCMADSSSLT
jgi:hypothetical protein